MNPYGDLRARDWAGVCLAVITGVIVACVEVAFLGRREWLTARWWER